MGFTSSLPTFVIAANKVAQKVAKLPHRAPGKRQLEPWDPTRCNYFEQEAINQAFFSLHNADIDEIESHGGGWKVLADLMTTKTLSSLNITCECRGGSSSFSNASSRSLNFCLQRLDARYVSALLTVEVVHLCGGTDLDAYAVKNWLFNVDKGARPYTYYPLLFTELQLMCAGGTKLPWDFNYLGGKFTVWDNVGGQLWPAGQDYRGRTVTGGMQMIDGGPTGPRTFWQYVC
jgi:hypothetical protein